MSKNIDQIYTANPITSNAATDLMYFGQSPYGAGNDAAMTYANFAAQFGGPITPSALTETNDTNVTLTLGGTPATALLKAVSITVGWSGTLSLARGGTNANLTAANGAVPYSTGTALALLAPGTSGQLLQSGGSGAPSWTTATFPTTAGTTGTILRSNGTNYVASTSTFADTYTINTILYAGSANTVTGMASAQNGVLVSNNTNIPSMLAGPGVTGQVLSSNASGAPNWSTATFPTTGGASGNVLISNGTNYISSTSLWPNTVGASGQIVQSNGTSNIYTTATYPTVATSTGTMLRANGTNWIPSTTTFADTYAASTILYSNGANTVTGLATTNSASLVTSGSGVPSWQALSAGQVLIGTTSGAPAAAAINSGTGITVQNASGSITVGLSGTGPGTLTWNDVSGTTQAAAVNSGYIISSASQTTVTLPATAAEGSVFGVQGKGAAGWILKMNTGQTCNFGSSATSSAGSLTSTNQWDSVQIVCVTANTTFAVLCSIGNLTIA